MTIALDFDGTFDLDPPFWRTFCELARAAGHKVLIVSCRHDDEAGESIATMMEMTGLEKWRHKLTGGVAKRWWMEQAGWKVDVWIDDDPRVVESGK